MSDVNSLFRDNLNNWANLDTAPPEMVEISHPLFCEKLGVDPKQFSFKTYAQPGESTDWYQAPIEFPDVIEGTMYLYLPSRWTSDMKQSNVVQICEGNRVRQTLILASKEDWKKTLPDFFDIGETAAFAYYPVHLPYYDQWVACVDMQEKIWIYTFYGAGDWILITKGDAGGRNTLGLQITSSIHSSPWYSWIASAQ